MVTVRFFSCVNEAVIGISVLEILIPYFPFQLWLFNADTAVITNVESSKAVDKTGIYSIRNEGIYQCYMYM